MQLLQFDVTTTSVIQIPMDVNVVVLQFDVAKTAIQIPMDVNACSVAI